MQKINLAVIGTGHLGSRHAKIYSELKDTVNLIGVCDCIEERSQNTAKEYQSTPYVDYRQLFGKVDAVSICVPTRLHYQVAKEFLGRGIHTLVEKPITASLREADGLVSLAKRKKLILQVGHVERFNSAFQAVKKIITNPRFIECHRLSLFPNRSLDVGVVLDLMIHDIDIILGLISPPIKDVQAVGINVLTAFEDIANARITFKNGCVCNLTASRISDERMRKIRIFFENTYISLDYVNQEASLYRKDKSAIAKQSLPIEKEEPLKQELESFIDCVRSGHQPVVSGIEGREALKLALTIQEKIWRSLKK